MLLRRVSVSRVTLVWLVAGGVMAVACTCIPSTLLWAVAFLVSCRLTAWGLHARHACTVTDIHELLAASGHVPRTPQLDKGAPYWHVGDKKNAQC